MRRYLARAVSFVTVVSAAVCGFAPRANAIPNIGSVLFVRSVDPIGGCSSGQQTWNLNAELDLANTSISPTTDITVVTRTFPIQYSAGPTAPLNADVIDDGGFAPGLTIPLSPSSVPNNKYDLVLHATIPCGAQSAGVRAEITFEGSDIVFHTNSAQFYPNIEVPVGTIGLLGLAAALGLSLLWVQRRSGRRHPVDPGRANASETRLTGRL